MRINVITPESFDDSGNLELTPMGKWLFNENKPTMINQTYNDIVTPELLAGAIENNEFEGFAHDYAVLHCLIRKYKPTSLFEIGTSIGTGTNILANAGKNWYMKVYSLDNFQDNGDRTGTACKFAYTQLRGDSLEFNYANYPCEAYYIDGAHTTKHVYHETGEVLSLLPKIIVFHDTDVPEVMAGITRAINGNTHYDLYRVTDTRVSYLLKRTL